MWLQSARGLLLRESWPLHGVIEEWTAPVPIREADSSRQTPCQSIGKRTAYPGAKPSRTYANESFGTHPGSLREGCTTGVNGPRPEHHCPIRQTTNSPLS